MLSAFCSPGPRSSSIPVNVTIQPSDTAGFRGYIRGSASAPVEITEYADYQCPFCQTFATLQMPTIDERLIKTGRLRWRYRDFPLQQHQFSRVAAHSAACADEQGKYWEQHERIYEGQAEWSTARDASDNFREYAKAMGMDLGKYDQCMESGKYAGRIQASYEEGAQAGVSVDADAAGGRSALSRPDRLGRDPATGGLAEPTHPVSDDEESTPTGLGDA